MEERFYKSGFEMNLIYGCDRFQAYFPMSQPKVLSVPIHNPFYTLSPSFLSSLVHPVQTQALLPAFFPSSVVVPSPTLPVRHSPENDKGPASPSICIQASKSAFAPPLIYNSHEPRPMPYSQSLPDAFSAELGKLLFSRSGSQSEDTAEDRERRWKREKKLRGKHKCSYPGCDDGFQSKFSLRRHMKTHTGERPFVCNWQDPYLPDAAKCGKRFAENSTLKRHVQTHTGEKPYSCPWTSCRKLFADNVNLKRHLRLVHEDTKPSKYKNQF